MLQSAFVSRKHYVALQRCRLVQSDIAMHISYVMAVACRVRPVDVSFDRQGQIAFLTPSHRNVFFVEVALESAGGENRRRTMQIAGV